MPPREANNPFPDQYLTLDYEGAAAPVGILQHEPAGGQNVVGTQTTDPGVAGPNADDDDDTDFTDADAAIGGSDGAGIGASGSHEGGQLGGAGADAPQPQQRPAQDPLMNEGYLPGEGGGAPMAFHGGAPMGSFRLNEAIPHGGVVPVGAAHHPHFSPSQVAVAPGQSAGGAGGHVPLPPGQPADGAVSVALTHHLPRARPSHGVSAAGPRPSPGRPGNPPDPLSVVTVAAGSLPGGWAGSPSPAGTGAAPATVTPERRPPHGQDSHGAGTSGSPYSAARAAAPNAHSGLGGNYSPSQLRASRQNGGPPVQVGGPGGPAAGGGNSVFPGAGHAGPPSAHPAPNASPVAGPGTCLGDAPPGAVSRVVTGGNGGAAAAATSPPRPGTPARAVSAVSNGGSSLVGRPTAAAASPGAASDASSRGTAPLSPPEFPPSPESSGPGGANSDGGRGQALNPSVLLPDVDGGEISSYSSSDSGDSVMEMDPAPAVAAAAPSPSPRSAHRNLHSVLDQSASMESEGVGNEGEDDDAKKSIAGDETAATEGTLDITMEDGESEDGGTSTSMPASSSHHHQQRMSPSLQTTPASASSVQSIHGAAAFDMGSSLVAGAPHHSPVPASAVQNNHHHHHHQQYQQHYQGQLHHLQHERHHLQQQMPHGQQEHQHQQHYGGVYQTSAPAASPPMALSFTSTTTVSDLKYYAERGLIVPLLVALDTPRLKNLGTRMLADYAKMSARRVAVASNSRILAFVSRIMVESPQVLAGQVGEDGSISDVAQLGGTGPSWLAREYAVETVRSLTATEESDRYLMGCPGLLQTLACVARGGPFVAIDGGAIREGEDGIDKAASRQTVGMASPKARLHACIAIMNLSCGKSNKIEIAANAEVLDAMRDVMLAINFPARSSGRSDGGRAANVAEEARFKATTCIKNLSNADANDGALLGCQGLVEALGVVAKETCSEERGATTCTTNACLALMNLSISKANKHRVFRTRGVMDSLMGVIRRTTPSEGHSKSSANPEARVKACSALSNLAIGYDNKIPMFNYPGFVDSILGVIETDAGEARTKACSILWSFAAEMKNQVPVVQRSDILPTLVNVAEDDSTTEARFKCVAALTLLAESLDNAIPLLQSDALNPLMDILHEAGPDPTQWKGQTASWCVGFLMNIAQSDAAVPHLREAGVVELLAPLLSLDHYQSLKAAMAITFVCRYDEGIETYDLLRKTENVIPKIIHLLHNTLSGKGGQGYKYGVFTLRSSVGCISSLASGPDFMKERIATKPVFESLLQVISDFCVDGGTTGAIVGGGKDDSLSATLAIRALQSLMGHLIPIAGSSSLPKEFVNSGMEDKLLRALESFEVCPQPDITDDTRRLASDARMRVLGSKTLTSFLAAKAAGDTTMKHVSIEDGGIEDDAGSAVGSIAASMTSSCCGGLPDGALNCWPASATQTEAQSQLPRIVEPSQRGDIIEMDDSSAGSSVDSQLAVRTFLLTDERTGRRFAVPSDPSGGRSFNDNREWCYRRGRFCRPGEKPDANFQWSDDLQTMYTAALVRQEVPS